MGNPHASWLVDQMVREIKQGLKDRNIEHRFAAFQTYAGEQLDYTAGKASASEITGNCRLSWYDHLMRNPLKAPGEAEQFTSKLHQALRNDAAGLDKALMIAREKMDAGKREPQEISGSDFARTGVGDPEASVGESTNGLHDSNRTAVAE